MNCKLSSGRGGGCGVFRGSSPELFHPSQGRDGNLGFNFARREVSSGGELHMGPPTSSSVMIPTTSTPAATSAATSTVTSTVTPTVTSTTTTTSTSKAATTSTSMSTITSTSMTTPRTSSRKRENESQERGSAGLRLSQRKQRRRCLSSDKAASNLPSQHGHVETFNFQIQGV